MSAPALIALSFTDVENWALTWLPILFMGLIVLLIGVTLRHMPRTKPQEIKPQSSDSISWDDVAGVNEAKAELREVVDFLRDSKRFKRLGAKVPKGILLHGPPGTGKTLLAKAVAHESNAKFFAQSASSFVEMFAGLGAARIRRLFRIARKQAPAIIFIDELDAVGATRGKDISGEKDKTLNQLLVEMDGFASADNIVVIAASNMLDKLDPALLRPGRFDRQVFVSPPDLTGRDEILRVHSANKPLAGVDLELVADVSSPRTAWSSRSRCAAAGRPALRAARWSARSTTALCGAGATSISRASVSSSSTPCGGSAAPTAASASRRCPSPVLVLATPATSRTSRPSSPSRWPRRRSRRCFGSAGTRWARSSSGSSATTSTSEGSAASSRSASMRSPSVAASATSPASPTTARARSCGSARAETRPSAEQGLHVPDDGEAAPDVANRYPQERSHPRGALP